MRTLSSGSLTSSPHLPFVLVTRIGGLDQIGAGADLQHQVDEVLQLEIVHARRHVDAVAGVEADPILGNAAQRVIDRLDAQRDEARQSSIEASGRAIVVGRHARIVDLQQEARIDDRLVFLVHGVGERRQIFLVRRVEAVLVIELEIGRRDRGDERLLGRDAVERAP